MLQERLKKAPEPAAPETPLAKNLRPVLDVAVSTTEGKEPKESEPKESEPKGTESGDEGGVSVIQRMARARGSSDDE